MAIGWWCCGVVDVVVVVVVVLCVVGVGWLCWLCVVCDVVVLIVGVVLLVWDFVAPFVSSLVEDPASPFDGVEVFVGGSKS